jgi:hypothetical protein
MTVLFRVAAFLGAWSLVLGPVIQAAIELQAEEVDRAGLAAAKDAVEPPAPISPWWWLLPPAALVLQRRLSRRYRAAVILGIPPEERQRWTGFADKAAAWLLVGTGGLLLAANETHELVDALGLPAWSVWWGIALALVVCAAVIVGWARRAARRSRASRS